MENLNNLPPFYVGQKVIANCSHGNIIKNKEYIVNGIFKGHCNSYIIDIGDTNTHNLSKTKLTCCCGTHYNNPKYGHWLYDSKRFNTVKESVFPSLTMSKVLEKESQLISMN